MTITRTIRRFINRLRGVPPVLACFAVGCAGQVAEPPAPATCESAYDGCVAVCPDAGAPNAARSSCTASCAASYGACAKAATPDLVCERVGEDHGCASSGCWATLECNRNPSAEMGVTCNATGGGLYACRW